MPDLPKTLLVGTGGTVGITVRRRTDLLNYPTTGSRILANDLLSEVPEIADVARVTAIDYKGGRAGNVPIEEWPTLAAMLNDALRGDQYVGAVVTHGTNMLEELAYFLHLTLEVAKPVVLVGSLRPTSGLSSDSHLNLLNSVRLASRAEHAGMGVLVTMNDTIHSARDVTKTATYGLDAFQSRTFGPLGVIDNDGRCVFYRRPTRRHTVASEFRVDRSTRLPRVALVVSHAGGDGSLIYAAVDGGFHGVVVATSGAGGMLASELDAVGGARTSGVAVVLASRTGSGRVVRTSTMVENDLVAGDDLPPWKACVLLSLALTKVRSSDDIQMLFEEY